MTKREMADQIARTLRLESVVKGHCICGADAEVHCLSPGFVVPVFAHRDDCPIVLARFSARREDIIEFDP